MALNSVTEVQLLDLLCEGPIGGVIKKYKGLYINETPIQNDDGTYNYTNDDLDATLHIGSANETKTNFFTDVSTITSVGQEIGENYSEELNENNEVILRDYGAGKLTRQITDTQVSQVQLLFTLPKLFSVAQEGLAKGQLFGATVKLEIYVQAKGSGGGFSNVLTLEKTGISTNNYQFLTPLINLKSYGNGPWNIRVEKVNLGENHFEIKYTDFEDIPENTPVANGRGNQVIWSSITEYTPKSVNYNYSATAEWTLSSESFPQLPTRAYLIKGRTVKIPAGATALDDGRLLFEDTAFDGSLQSAEKFTTCPVCCFYDLLTNPRYGCGDFVAASNLNWVDLYPLAKYSNQLVTNPDGTQEARFACNVVIGDQADAYSVLQDMASIFRGILFWSNNVIQVTADHGNLDGSDLTVSHVYSNSNVINGAFEYSGSSLKTRSTSIRVRYNDPENFYKPNIVVVEDAGLIAKYGYQVKELIGFGCTSKWQAQRVGLWALNTENLDEEVIAFSTGLEGAVVLPGEIFAVADQLRQGTRISGRIKATPSVSQIVIDQRLDSLPAGANPKLTCVMPDGTIETLDIFTLNEDTISLIGGFSALPGINSIYSITTDGVANQKFRCLSVSDNGNGTYSITGITHNDSIYAAVDNGEELQPIDVTTFDNSPPPPTNIAFSAGQITDGTGLKIQANVSWSQGSGGATFGYKVKWSTSTGNKDEKITTNPNLTVPDLLEGQVLTVTVTALGLGLSEKNASAAVSGSFTIPSFASASTPTASVITLPEDPQNVTLELISGEQVALRWKTPSGGFGGNLLTAIIRHAPQTDGTGEWANSTLLSDSISGATTQAILPKIDGEYLLKFRNLDGQVSANAVSAILDQPDPIPQLSVTVVREDTTTPPFQGQKDSVFYSEEYDGLVIDGNQTVDQIPPPTAEDPDNTGFNGIGSLDFTGTQLLSGRYYFTDIIDLGGKFTAKFKRKLTTRGLYPADLIDSRNENIDRWTDFDGLIADGTSAELYFRTSDVATADAFFLLETGENLLLETGDQFELESDIDFGEWVPMFSGEYAGRQFQFKAELSSVSVDQTPIIDELGFELVMESRTEQSATIASGAGAKAVSYAKAFYQEPSLGLTAFNMQSGDYYAITSPSATGFTVTFYDSSNTAVDRNFQYVASGYGTAQT